MTSGTKQQRDPVTLLTICVLWLAMGVFVLYPIVRLLAMTFIVDGHLTFENLLPFLANWYDRRAIVNSIILACAVGFAGTIIGFIFAFAVTRLSLPKWLTFFHIKYCADALLGAKRHHPHSLRLGKLQFLRLLGHVYFRNADILPHCLYDVVDDSHENRPELRRCGLFFRCLSFQRFQIRHLPPVGSGFSQCLPARVLLLSRGLCNTAGSGRALLPCAADTSLSADYGYV